MPLLRLLNTNVCPPDGFRFVFPQDGYVAHSWTYNDWLNAALMHAQANNMPVPTEAEMEHQLCQTLPPGWCNYDDPSRPRVTTSLDWDAVKGGLATFARWIATGCEYVQKTEAERRALICNRCYMNTNVSGCAACHAATEEVVKGRSTKYDFSLKACAVCKCFLRAKVHFPLKVLDKENSSYQQLYPEHCWLKKSGPNYGG